MPRHMNKVWWPYQVTIEIKTRNLTEDTGWVDRNRWLREHYSTMTGDYFINGETYCFTDERDMLHFLLVNQ